MNQEQQPMTLTLDGKQVEYLRKLLAYEASEGERVEDDILEDGAEHWGGDFPDSTVNAAYERGEIAESILSQLG